MPIELTRAQLLISVFVASVLVLVVLGNPSASPMRVSAWLPRQPASSNLAIANMDAPASAPQPITAMAQAGTTSVPLSLAGDVGFNVLSALGAQDGALRNVTIQPGQTWSFNATLGSPAYVEIRTVGGVPGGGWCDLASRYVQAVRPLLPPEAVRFVNHVTASGIRIADVADDDAVSIWNVNGQAGSSGQSQDLEITNTLSVPLHFQVIERGDQQIVVSASVGG
ncbi:MAG TPA: hypothetical protein VFU22_33610 [Roseiflexaceae bacterium]|nr:hypothetical protein [Roseiflexaceae bacterium]